MLYGMKLMCLTLIPTFLNTGTLTTPPSTAMQIIEKQVDIKYEVQVNNLGLIKHPIQVQFEKDKLELEKKKAEEERLKELELKRKQEDKQKKKEPEWQEFILTFYTSLNSENGYGAITCTGDKLYDGLVASNYYKLNTKIQLEGWGEVTIGDRGGSNFNNDYRLDVYIEREAGESDREYIKRVNSYGRQKVKGYIIK